MMKVVDDKFDVLFKRALELWPVDSEIEPYFIKYDIPRNEDTAKSFALGLAIAAMCQVRKDVAERKSNANG